MHPSAMNGAVDGIDHAPPPKRRKPNSDQQERPRQTEGMWNNSNDSPEQAHGDAARQTSPETATQSQTARSCENCRRCKLRCSKEDPCSKCVLKGIPCVYELDKRRGPRPGYIEELYRRIDALEQMVIGQSLLLRDQSNASVQNFRDTVLGQRNQLRDSGLEYIRRSGKGNSEENGEQTSTAVDAEYISRMQQPDQSKEFLEVWETYRHMIQPWIPVLHPINVSNAITSSGKRDTAWWPVFEAIIIATALVEHGAFSNSRNGLKLLQSSVFQATLCSPSMENLQAAVIFYFLKLGEGTISDTMGLSVYLPQLALRAGMHLEDHRLTAEQREYRTAVGYHEIDTSWAGKEAARRLFWNIFLLEQTSAIFCGIETAFDSSAIGRLLPCDGNKWLEDHSIHTREFVPAMVAVQARVATDSNIGGFAYAIEATEILRIVSAFALKFARMGMSRVDQRAYLQEFLNLDLVLMNWKTRLPARFQRASYDESGYMDHNVTLAHMSHNTSVILLCQSSRALHLSNTNGVSPQSPLTPPLLGIKQAAKETAKICTRFLLHRQYLVSPQFSFCQFIAARALLAYSSWMMEPLDEDFDILYTALGESAQRWSGVSAELKHHKDTLSLDNFAVKLLKILKTDMQKPGHIDLTIPCAVLMTRVADHHNNWADLGGESEQSFTWFAPSHNDPQNFLGSSGLMGQHLIQAAPSGDQLNTTNFPESFQGMDPCMALFSSTHVEAIGNRIFSWHDGDEDPPGGGYNTTHVS